MNLKQVLGRFGKMASPALRFPRRFDVQFR